jgi:hypothetical protein
MISGMLSYGSFSLISGVVFVLENDRLKIPLGNNLFFENSLASILILCGILNFSSLLKF